VRRVRQVHGKTDASGGSSRHLPARLRVVAGFVKAQRFGRELASRGVGYTCPDLNLPAFETLTVTRMLESDARCD